MYIDDKFNNLEDFAKQTDLSLQVLKQNKIAGEHIVVYAEQSYKIKQDVFSPAIFNGWRTFVPLLEQEESVCGDMLEIGCGSGIVGLHLLKVHKIQSLTASDISAIAVENTRENAQMLHLENLVTVMESDVYDNLVRSKKYDVIFWNHPWIPKEDTYDLKTREILEYGLFDPGYKFLKRFISQAENHLKPDGVIYIGFGDFGDLDALRSICATNGYKIRIVGEQIGQENGEVNFELYKIYR